MLAREQVLPVGSVVILKEEPTLKFMITGYYPVVDGVVYDYTAVFYPTGNRTAQEVMTFNADVIQSVVHKGYQKAGFDLMLDALESGYAQLQRKLAFEDGQ